MGLFGVHNHSQSRLFGHSHVYKCLQARTTSQFGTSQLWMVPNSFVVRACKQCMSGGIHCLQARTTSEFGTTQPWTMYMYCYFYILFKGKERRFVLPTTIATDLNTWISQINLQMKTLCLHFAFFIYFATMNKL